MSAAPLASDIAIKAALDSRDIARDVAAALEGMNAAALTLHVNQAYCQEHGFNDHGCGGDLLYRCFRCIQQTDNHLPCATWRALTGEWVPS